MALPGHKLNIHSSYPKYSPPSPRSTHIRRVCLPTPYIPRHLGLRSFRNRPYHLSVRIYFGQPTICIPRL